MRIGTHIRMEEPQQTSLPLTSSTEAAACIPQTSRESCLTSIARRLHAIIRLCCITLPTFLCDGVRLLFFALALSPAFARMLWYYYVSSHRESVQYGNVSVRQTLDVFTTPATEAQPPKKVVLFFCCGGAWMIGYKMWGALLARVMDKTGMVVVLPDYRNYPWGCVGNAVEDVELALDWVVSTYREHDVVLVGQSAGGHLLMTMMLRKALRKQEQEKQGTNSSDSDNVKGLFVLSAPLQLDLVAPSFQKHGMNEETVNCVFGNEISEYDPFALLERINCASSDEAVDKCATDEQDRQTLRKRLLPPTAIYHGTSDKTVPFEGSEHFFQRLQASNICESTVFGAYEGWSHTDPILEGPASADHRFHHDILRCVEQWTGDSAARGWLGGQEEVLQRMCPRVLVVAARFFMPF